MKLLAFLLNKDQRILRRKKIAEKQQEILLQMGREQFKRLVDKGLTVPIAYL